jgi:DNA-binding NtrC family response regulator
MSCHRLAIDSERLARRALHEPDGYGDLIGVSPAMRELFSQLARLERSEVSVLIKGESGTGKELVARAIHGHSVRRRGPLVTVNSGALDRHLVKSELFGHRRGAFTGAVQSQVGAFVAADGGTLFLDEIGELPLDVQPVLLRALESRVVVPLGSHAERVVDVRVIAATHRDLHALVESGQFREDLLYRIQVACLEIPPLRARRQDVPVLAHALAERRGAGPLPRDFLEALAEHGWPGNVRELCNAVEAFLALGAVPGRARAPAAQTLDASLAAFVNPGHTYADQKSELVERFTRVYLSRLMEATANNQSRAARVSGLERSYLGKLIAKLGLRAE